MFLLVEGDFSTSSTHGVGSLEMAFTKALCTFAFTLKSRVERRKEKKKYH